MNERGDDERNRPGGNSGDPRFDAPQGGWQQGGPQHGGWPQGGPPQGGWQQGGWQQGGPQQNRPQGNWHPEGLPPSAMHPAQPPESDVPVDIETARHLWMGVVGLGLISMVLGLWVLFSDRDAFLDQLLADMQAADQSVALTAETADGVLVTALVLSLLLGVLIAGLVLLVVKKMREGKLWARTVLTAVGVIVVVTTLPTLFGLGSLGGGIVVVTSVLGILQAVLAAGAVYLMHRRESLEYFLSKRAPK